MKEYLPQIIASAIVIILLPVSRYLLAKIIVKSGRIIQMPESRILQIKQIVNILLNIVFLFSIAIVWGVQPDNILLGLSSVFAVIGVAFFCTMVYPQQYYRWCYYVFQCSLPGGRPHSYY